MSELKSAWIGVGGTVLGVVLTLGAQPAVTKWLGPLTEGTYTIEESCFSPRNLDPAVAKQIVSYPCQVRIAHVEGPAVQKLGVVVTSRHRMVDLKVERNDENVVPALSNDDSILKIDVATLRQGGVIDIRFASLGEPSIEQRSVHESGRLLSDPRPKHRTGFWWWANEWYGIVGFVVISAALAVGGTMLLYQSIVQQVVGKLSPNEKLAALALVLVSSIPFVDLGTVVQTTLLLAVLHIVSQGRSA